MALRALLCSKLESSKIILGGLLKWHLIYDVEVILMRDTVHVFIESLEPEIDLRTM
jgi:hypothetical protein